MGFDSSSRLIGQVVFAQFDGLFGQAARSLWSIQNLPDRLVGSYADGMSQKIGLQSSGSVNQVQHQFLYLGVPSFGTFESSADVIDRPLNSFILMRTKLTTLSDEAK